MVRGKGSRGTAVRGSAIEELAKSKDGGRAYTESELADLKGQKKEVDELIKFSQENPNASGGKVDVGKLQREGKYLEAMIHEHTPKGARGFSKDKLAEEAKAIEEQLKTNMPTKAEMNAPADHPGAIQKHIRWTKANDALVLKYRQIKRKLDPDDPTSGDVEKLRREK